MEKQHFNKKNIKSLKTGPGITVNLDKEIIDQEAHSRVRGVF